MHLGLLMFGYALQDGLIRLELLSITAIFEGFNKDGIFVYK
jgi:hypothetical protein